MFKVKYFLLILFFAQNLSASEALYNGIYRGYEGTRALGMGGAFVALANDNTAIMYNPAALVKVPEGELDLVLKAGTDSDFLDFLKELESQRGDQSNTTDAQDLTDFLVNKYGTHYSLRAPSLGALYARPGWGFAIIPLDLSVDMSLHRLVGPAINLVAYNDATIAVGLSWMLHEGRFGKISIGVTPKAIYRFNIDKVVSIADIQQDGIIRTEDGREGLTVDADLGMLWQFPDKESGFWKYFNPSFAAVIRNAADYGYLTKFNLMGKDSRDPEKLIRRLDLGTAVKLPSWWIFSSTLCFDVRDILHPNWTFTKGYHLGAEFAWELFSWWKGGWRVGLNQGYWTAGFTGEFGVFKLDLASFGEEVGTQSSKLENRRYQISMSLDF